MSPAPVTIRALWDQNAPYLLRCLRYLGVREADLDDAMQETFMIAHRKIASLETTDAPRPWLYAIGLNVARHLRRARATVSLDDAPAFEDPRDHAGRVHARLEMLSLLGTLDDERRELIVLYFVEELTLREIATMLGCPLQTVYSRLGAATKTLEALRSDPAPAVAP